MAFSAGGTFDWRTRIRSRSFSAEELWLSAAVAVRVEPAARTRASSPVSTWPKAKRRATTAFGISCVHLTAHGLFPLTPALSPRERENSRQSVGESEDAENCEMRPLRLPLPRGEGRGEGEYTFESWQSWKFCNEFIINILLIKSVLVVQAS